MPAIREYREILIPMNDFKRVLPEIVGSQNIRLTWTDYSEGYWVSEIKTRGFVYGLSAVSISSVSSRGVVFSEIVFD